MRCCRFPLRRTFVVSLVAIVALSASLGASLTASANDIAVIVHPDRKTRLALSDIVQIYLKQRRFWEDGGAIVPVNRDAGSAVRERFAKVVFDVGSHGLVAYWNREYFRGVLPPITLASDEAVLRFVAAEPRAVGYIPAVLVDDSVRVVYRID